MSAFPSNPMRRTSITVNGTPVEDLEAALLPGGAAADGDDAGPTPAPSPPPPPSGSATATGQQPLTGAAAVTWAVRTSLTVNLILLVAKAYAYWYSRSQALLASLADSVVDIAAQVIVWWADKEMKKLDPRYPVGRTRLETIGVMVVAVFMTVAAVEVAQSAFSELYGGFSTGELPPLVMDAVTYGILGAVIGAKVLLFLTCVSLRKVSDVVEALALDHLNDVMSNVVALAAAGVASVYVQLWWLDPVGGLLISAYIVVAWARIGARQIDKILGKAAPDMFLAFLRHIAQDHDARLKVDALRAYFFGARYLVEVEVLLPPEMSVRESHDIALALQHKVEASEEVERCFVHVDYQARPEPEHKVDRALLARRSELFSSEHRALLPRTYESFVRSNSSPQTLEST